MTSLRGAGPNKALAALFMLLLARPLAAKCPTHSVEVRGKIKCSFKPDDKVLVTLIFFDHQPEASGKETAIDLQGPAFSGWVAFDTLSSSGLFGGDKCHRRPKSVLIRLIEADGVEKDHVSLKIASDFYYDEERGEYTPKSDVTLHGSCQSQCSGTSLAVADWHKLDAGPFSIIAPSEWEFRAPAGF